MYRNLQSKSDRDVRGSERRTFLGQIAGATATIALGALGSPVASPAMAAPAEADGSSKNPGSQRAEQAYEMRHKAAVYQRNLPSVENIDNGDEQLYGNRIGNFSKGLPHSSLGEVDRDAYSKLLKAVRSGYPSDFENIPLGGKVPLANPQAAFTYCLEGADSHHFNVTTPPAFSGAESAAEMVELYWQALTRDIPFTEYEYNSLTIKAAAELTKLSAFRGPRIHGEVTPATLFRGNTPADLSGPYLSQFLLKSFQYGATPFLQRIRTAVPELNYMTGYSEWLSVQNGAKPGLNKFDLTSRYIGSSRGLAAFVREDFTYQAFLNACLILLGMHAEFDMGNPYMESRNQSAFSTFGPPHVLDTVARVANAGLRAAWYQKWLVHRKLRPEEFGGTVHRLLTGQATYPIHRDLLDSRALAETFSQSGTYLLSQAYAEGCPTHPSYPAGHAVVAGACATVLKAFFEESFVLRDPVKVSANGLSISTYKGTELTVGGELNKLAANIAIGRNAAGVHWRSDAMEGLRLGEAVALSIFAEGGGCLSENFNGFALTKFDGTTVVA